MRPEGDGEKMARRKTSRPEPGESAAPLTLYRVVVEDRDVLHMEIEAGNEVEAREIALDRVHSAHREEHRGERAEGCGQGYACSLPWRIRVLPLGGEGKDDHLGPIEGPNEIPWMLYFGFPSGADDWILQEGVPGDSYLFSEESLAQVRAWRGPGLVPRQSTTVVAVDAHKAMRQGTGFYGNVAEADDPGYEGQYQCDALGVPPKCIVSIKRMGIDKDMEIGTTIRGNSLYSDGENAWRKPEKDPASSGWRSRWRTSSTPFTFPILPSPPQLPGQRTA